MHSYSKILEQIASSFQCTIKNDIMSVENVIDELIKQDCKADCNHSFLEFFEKKTDVQFDIFFGS